MSRKRNGDALPPAGGLTLMPIGTDANYDRVVRSACKTGLLRVWLYDTGRRACVVRRRHVGPIEAVYRSRGGVWI